MKQSQAQSHSTIATQFASSILKSWSGDLGFSAKVLELLPRYGCTMIDLLEIVESGNVVAVTKEEPHETLFELVGRTSDGHRLSLTISFNPHIDGLSAIDFVRL